MYRPHRCKHFLYNYQNKDKLYALIKTIKIYERLKLRQMGVRGFLNKGIILNLLMIFDLDMIKKGYGS